MSAPCCIALDHAAFGKTDGPFQRQNDLGDANRGASRARLYPPFTPRCELKSPCSDSCRNSFPTVGSGSLVFLGQAARRVRRLFRAARHMGHQHDSVIRQFIESEHRVLPRLFRTTSHTGQQPNTIPIQYYFIVWTGGNTRPSWYCFISIYR